MYISHTSDVLIIISISSKSLFWVLGTIVNSVPDDVDEAAVTVPPASGSSFTNAANETDEIVNDDQNKPKDTSWASKLKVIPFTCTCLIHLNPLSLSLH